MKPPVARLPAIGVLLAGSMMASSAAIWIRFLPDVSPLAIAFVRVGGAALIFLPWFRREMASSGLSWHDFRCSILAGIALAAHFATWITSLRYTTVANSVLLVNTHPMFVIAISLFILRVPVARNQILGALLALAGIVFIQWRDLSFNSNGGMQTQAALGNLLALAGGLCAAIYLLLGRAARRTLSTILHVEVTYASAAVVLLITLVTVRTTPVPLDPAPWLFLGLLILLPTVGGHTIFNWGVLHLGAPLVSLFGLLEPIEAAILALLILGEDIGTTIIIGGAVVIAGLALALWPSATRTGEVETFHSGS